MITGNKQSYPLESKQTRMLRCWKQFLISRYNEWKIKIEHRHLHETEVKMITFLILATATLLLPNDGRQ